MVEIKCEIEISAPRETVWGVLWGKDSFPLWAGVIDDGTYLLGDIKEGNEVQFISAINGYGVTSLVARLDPGAYVLFRHQGDTKESGSKLREREWTGGSESYTLEQRSGGTILILVSEVPEELEEMFRIKIPQSLEVVKTLAQAKEAKVGRLRVGIRRHFFHGVKKTRDFGQAGYNDRCRMKFADKWNSGKSGKE